jgi:hypothetical protein
MNTATLHTAEGVVTGTKRPPGWVAPGPQPANLGAVQPAKGEALCYLTGDWRIFQPIGGHRYSTDDLVTGVPRQFATTCETFSW